MEQVIEYVAQELLKLQLNYAELQPYDDYNTVKITKELVHNHNAKLIELSNILWENKDGSRKSN